MQGSVGRTSLFKMDAQPPPRYTDEQTEDTVGPPEYGIPVRLSMVEGVVTSWNGISFLTPVEVQPTTELTSDAFGVVEHGMAHSGLPWNGIPRPKD